jgi:hypothetical protein
MDDRAATVSLNADATLTAQFFIEDHALRHSFHHLASIQAALNEQGVSRWIRISATIERDQVIVCEDPATRR